MGLLKKIGRMAIIPAVATSLLISSCATEKPTSPVPKEPTYSLKVTPSEGEAPLEVLLNASDSTGRAVEYGFDFGDGASYKEAEGNFPDGILDGKTRHIYWNSGQYVVKASVKDAKGKFHFLEDTLNFSERHLGGKIIFRQSVNSDRGEIFSMNPYGEDQKSLTGDFHPRMKCVLPSVSRDGLKIVFSLLYDLYGRHDYDIWIMNSDGLEKKQLTTSHSDELYAVISPDGNKIAYLGEGLLLIMNSNSSNRVSLGTDRNYGQKVSWSPDGERLVFSSRGDLHSIDSLGGDLKKLTDDAASEGFPSYSPDGTIIVFTRQDGWNGDMEIYTMNADGSNQRNISQNPNGNDNYPLWSPDGRKIAFVRSNYQPGFGERRAVFMMDADGSNQKNVSGNQSSNDFLSSWSPDGKYFVYSSYPIMGNHKLTQIFVADTFGLYKKQITNNEYFNGEATWIR